MSALEIRVNDLIKLIDESYQEMFVCMKEHQFDLIQTKLIQQEALLAELLGLAHRGYDKNFLVTYVKNILKQNQQLTQKVKEELDVLSSSLVHCNELKEYLF